MHRIDKDTSGLLVVAKSDRAHQGLARQFADHSASRRYLALAHGVSDAADARLRGLPLLAGKGGLDPDEFWHAWARGAEMTVDIFDPTWSVWDWVEHDLDSLLRQWNVTPPGNRR